jgi:hypothetical protein
MVEQPLVVSGTLTQPIEPFTAFFAKVRRSTGARPALSIVMMDCLGGPGVPADDTDDAMLRIGTDIAPDLGPLVYRALDRAPAATGPVPAFGLRGVRSAGLLEAAEQRASEAFDGADAVLRGELASMADMLPRSMRQLSELDADIARDLGSVDGGGP